MTTLFLGLGRMGLPMVRRYAASRPVVLHDVSDEVLDAAVAELGARRLSDLGDDLGGVDVVILMLPSSRVVESVLEGTDGLLERLAPNSLVVDMSSSEPESTRRLAGLAARRRIGYVDAPVSGGVAKAITGELAIMVGGAPEDVARALPHLSPMGTTLPVGPVGSGHAAKSLNNLLSATNIAAAAEVVSVATKFGIEPAVMVEVINASTGRSQASEVKFPRHILTGTHDSGFAFELMVKDIGIAEELARQYDVPLEVTGAAARTARTATSEGPADHTELARYVAERAGTSLARPPSGRPTGRPVRQGPQKTDEHHEDHEDKEKQ